MLELLQFSLLDMTPYDRQGWFNLVTEYTQAIWPAFFVAFLLMTALIFELFQVVKQPEKQRRKSPALFILAAGWIWVGAIFHLQYFSSLNWAAGWFGLAFLGQGFLLFATALFLKSSPWITLSSWRGRLGLGLLFIGLIVYPLSGLIEGRQISELEWPLLMPGPTTLVNFALLILLNTRLRYILIIIPMGWALISGAFAMTLGLLEVYFLAGAAICWVVSFFLPAKNAVGAPI